MTEQRRKAAANGKRPIFELLSLLGQRWVLRILWELRDGPLKFRALADACGHIPSASLNARLAELKRAEIIERTDGGYQLTARGSSLGTILLALNVWAKGWPQAWTWQTGDDESEP